MTVSVGIVVQRVFGSPVKEPLGSIHSDGIIHTGLFGVIRVHKNDKDLKSIKL